MSANNFFVKILTPAEATVFLWHDCVPVNAICHALTACDQDGQPIGEVQAYYKDEEGYFRISYMDDDSNCLERIPFESREEAYRSTLGDVILVQGPRYFVTENGGVSKVRWNGRYVVSYSTGLREAADPTDYGKVYKTGELSVDGGE
jgi:hypothetical protein